MTDPTTYIRREVVYHGRVQGVGFRATARAIAERFAVVGWVRNEPDGGVLLVAEGASDDVDRFVSAVTTELERYIRTVESQTLAATGELHGFTVRR